MPPSSGAFWTKELFAGSLAEAALRSCSWYRRSRSAGARGAFLAAITKFRKTERAFIIANSFPEGKWLGLSEEVEGWTIADMNGSELTLKNGARSVRLRLCPGDPQE